MIKRLSFFSRINMMDQRLLKCISDLTDSINDFPKSISNLPKTVQKVIEMSLFMGSFLFLKSKFRQILPREYSYTAV